MEQTIKKNSCTAYVTFVRNYQVESVELCGINEALTYVSDVVLKNGWKFIGIQRGCDYKN